MLLYSAVVIVFELAYLICFMLLCQLQLTHFFEAYAHRLILPFFDIVIPNLMLELREHLLFHIRLLSGRPDLLVFALLY